MNCLEFRRACLVDPLSREPDFSGHDQACPTCHGFLQQQIEQERRLRAALAIEPPPGLAARILLRQSFAQRTRLPLALAASVAFVAMAITIGFQMARAPAIDAEVLAHIHAEPDHLTSMNTEPPGKVAMVLQALGATVEMPLSDVRYAGVCDISNRPGAHLVLSGERGPVTVLLLPQHMISRAMPVRADQLEGIVLPVQGGSIALVGNRGEDIGALARRLNARLTGPRA